MYEFLKFYIGVSLISNMVLSPDVQQNDSVIHIYVCVYILYIRYIYICPLEIIQMSCITLFSQENVYLNPK